MDKEQQIRLNFLDEAEEYFDLMESNTLGLADAVIDNQKLDLILRSAHSIKGGAAMMGFDTLSRVAHRLEDFLKILRVRHTSGQTTTEVETLLLQGIDLLRDVSKLNRQGREVTESAISDRSKPIFEQLRQHLGDLEDADENALMAQEEDVDPAVLIFEEGVDAVLDRFEQQLTTLEVAELPAELTNTVQELIGLGKMANLQSFIQLCQSIQQQAQSLSPLEIVPLAEQALIAWKRSHALVLRGKIEKLPTCLEDNGSAHNKNAINSLAENIAELSELQAAFELEDATTEQSQPIETDFNPLEENIAELSELQAAFELEGATTEQSQPIETDFNPLGENIAELSELQAAFELETDTLEQSQLIHPPNPTVFFSPQKTSSVDKMVRVPVSQLKQFNSLFEQLILDRNTISLRLKQLQNVMFLMNQRMMQMERSNTHLKQWYDRASIEGLLSNQQQPAIPQSVSPLTSNHELAEDKLRSNLDRASTYSDRFDTLEMDRYSEVHLICQEQIETIVQLQEVSTDIELGLQDISQAVRNLDYTTKSMQGNVTRTQMLPFAEVVKRFPRVIRDLNLQFNKQVDLKIIGENSLLDRSIIETLSDPLMHLLRNAFDHGIEDAETRIAAGKAPSGTITIQASSRGTYTMITVSDDGAGISLEQIRERLCQMGIPQSEVAQIPEAELLDFIFDPGFSTAKQATELSGRGIGMDVVRTNLQEVRGNVRVATKPGQGTTFTLRIPFTLSILRVAIIEQAGIILAVPANTIRELIPLESEQVKTSEDNKYLLWNQTEIPLVEIEKTLVYRRFHNSFSLTENPAINRPLALIVGDEKSYAALKISCFWHEQESTIRQIDSPLPLPPGVISSMVFGDGKVIPLIDPILLIEECLNDNLIQDRQNNQVSKNLSTTDTILIADDSINVRRYLSLTLEKAGYRVEQAKDGQEAVDKLLSGLAVQAVICDIEMPRLDGYGVLEEIRERAEFQQLPIIMLTSRSNEKHRKLAMNLGASAYLSKPYNEQQLLDKLAKMLDSESITD